MTEAYDVLDIPRNADQAAIRKAYLRASLRSHPDKNPGREEEAQAEFVKVGQAYSILRDPVKRAAYDRELGAGGKATSTPMQQQADSDEDSFQNFADLFDETVAGMSEQDLNMAMGMAATIGSLVGSIAGARAGKGGNSALSAIGSAIGSAMASQAASTLVKSVHEDSTQRALEKKEREVAIARGETVPEPSARGNRGRVFQDAGRAFQKVGNFSSGNNATSNSGDEKKQFSWKEAAKLATMAASTYAEMKREPKYSSK